MSTDTPITPRSPLSKWLAPCNRRGRLPRRRKDSQHRTAQDDL